MKLNSNIPIRNIYYMLCYAFHNLHKDQEEKLGKESFKNSKDMFAAFLSLGISYQLKHGLYREYINRHDTLPLLRGKLDIQGTIRNKQAQKLVLACEFDELSENNIFNQILKTTAYLFIRDKSVDFERKAVLKKQMLFFGNVSRIEEPRSIRWKDIHYHRNNQRYQWLLDMCQLIINGMLLKNETGELKLANFLDDRAMHWLYEKFILNYYKWHYDKKLSSDAKEIEWAVDKDFGKEKERSQLPDMKTDIFLEKKKDKKILIIDAKCYSSNLQDNHGKKTIISGHLYQILTYVKNCQWSIDYQDYKVYGMLLYAKTDEAIQPELKCKIHGSEISARTLDLNQDFADIRADLDKIVKDYFNVEIRF